MLFFDTLPVTACIKCHRENTGGHVEVVGAEASGSLIVIGEVTRLDGGGQIVLNDVPIDAQLQARVNKGCRCGT